MQDSGTRWDKNSSQADSMGSIPVTRSTAKNVATQPNRTPSPVQISAPLCSPCATIQCRKTAVFALIGARRQSAVLKQAIGTGYCGCAALPRSPGGRSSTGRDDRCCGPTGRRRRASSRCESAPGRAAFFPVILSVKILSARLRSAPLSESAGFDPASTRVANRPHVYLPNPVSLVRFVWP